MASLSEDPTILAWRRALGFEDQANEANAAQQTAAVQQRVGLERPEVEFQGGESRRNISGGFEDRGLFRSGEHERALAVQRHGEQQSLAGLDLAAATDIGGIQSSLALQLAQARRQQAEALLTAAQNLETQDQTRALG